MQLINAFWVGGLFCVIAQVLIDKTKITPAWILVLYVVAGCLLSLFNIFEPLIDFAGAGATVPLVGFGYALGKGVKEAITELGWIGIFTGGLTATAAGLTAAMLFGFIFSCFFKSAKK